jgi:hypothetical protein
LQTGEGGQEGAMVAAPAQIAGGVLLNEQGLRESVPSKVPALRCR